MSPAAVKKWLMTAGAGVVDEDYRGPVGVVLFNHSDSDFAGQALQVTCASASLTGTAQKETSQYSQQAAHMVPVDVQV